MQRVPNLRGGDARDLGRDHDSEAEPLEQRQVACTSSAEAEVRPRDDHLDACRTQVALGELRRLEVHHLAREADDECLLDTELAEQPQAALERGQQLDPVPERESRVRIEGHRVTRRPVAIAACTTLRWPRWTPSKLPIATALGRRSSSAGVRAMLTEPSQSLVRRNHTPLVSFLDPEGADLSASECDAVTSERVGDRSHVRPGADAQIERDHAVAIRDDVERVDPRAPQRHFQGDALAVQAVRALAADLDRGRGRDRQLDVASEGCESRQLRPRRRVAQLSAPPPDRRSTSGTQIDVREVALVESDEA